MLCGYGAGSKDSRVCSAAGREKRGEMHVPMLKDVLRWGIFGGSTVPHSALDSCAKNKRRCGCSYNAMNLLEIHDGYALNTRQFNYRESMAGADTAHIRIGEALKQEATLYAKRMELDLSSFVRYCLRR